MNTDDSKHMQSDEETVETVDLDMESTEEVDHSECEERIVEAEGKYKRALADYQNLERQTRESNSRFVKLATQSFVEDMIEPYDHLKLAAAHVKDKGLDMVMTQFKAVFESQGVREINPMGKMFDAHTMEAVDTTDGEDGKVITVMSSGYELNGIVVKAAKVIVGKKNN